MLTGRRELTIRSGTPHPRTGGATLVRRVQRGGFDEQPLPLVALAVATEAHNNGGQVACPVGATGKSGVTRRQEHQVVQASTAQAHRTGVLHQQQVPSA